MKCRLSLVLGAVILLAACAQRNDLAPVEVWGHPPAGPTAVVPPPPPPMRAVTLPAGSIRVMPGDTLYGISRRTGVPVRTIIEANLIAPPYRLEPGSVLVLPPGRQHFVPLDESPASVARPDTIAANPPARTSPSPVHAGQTLALPPAAIPPPPPRPPSLASAATRIESGEVPPSAEPPSVAPPPPSRMMAMAPPPPPKVPPPEPLPATAPPPKPALPAVAPSPPRPVEAAPVAAAAPPPKPAPPSAEPAPSPAHNFPAAPPEHPKPIEPAAAPMMPPAPPPPGTPRGFVWPVQGRIIASYGTSESGVHSDGINIAAPAGTPVLAAAAGTVAYVGNELRGYGNLVLIKHDGGYLTAYAHNGTILVHRGDRVARGQPIARVGATGTVSQPQLHFEIRAGRNAVDPLPLLPQAAQPASAKG